MSQKTCATGMVVGCQEKNKFSCYNFLKGLQLSIPRLGFPEGKGDDRFKQTEKFGPIRYQTKINKKTMHITSDKGSCRNKISEWQYM